MKIVVAPDSFKGSLEAAEVADCIEIGIRKVFNEAEIIKVPMADGGEGTVKTLVKSTGGEIIKVRALGPLLNSVEAYYGVLGDNRTAVIEMATASGLPLVSLEEKNPLITSTYGTGELIKHALEYGCRKIIVGIGGSATNDGGAGMARALGIRFLDKAGMELSDGGGGLSELVDIDMSCLDARLKETEILVACDVNNPLCGENGASYVYAPQKGANQEMVKILDNSLRHFGNIVEEKLGIKIMEESGTGAAGGLGFGMKAFLGAGLKKGIEIVIEAAKLEDKLKDADLVITGEGRMDNQTFNGKTPYGVAMLAKKKNIPVIGIAGGIEDVEELYNGGFNGVFSILDKPMTLEEAVSNCEALIIGTTEGIMRGIRIGMGMGMGL